MKRTIGYLRVSTADQDIEKNKSDILKLANEKRLGSVDWVEEKVTGTKNWRKRKLGKVFNSLNAGDTIIVSELSRLGRSTFVSEWSVERHCTAVDRADIRTVRNHARFCMLA